MKATLRVVSNLSFTATLSKHKPLIFLEKVGGLWFLASEKRPPGTDLGLGLYLGRKKSLPDEWQTLAGNALGVAVEEGR